MAAKVTDMLHFEALAVRFLILAIWSVTPLSWAYVLLTILHQYRPLSLMAHPLPLLHPVMFLYSTLECAFSIYHRYLTYKVQRLLPPPNYSRSFLRSVLIRALESGMDDHDGDDGDSEAAFAASRAAEGAGVSIDAQDASARNGRALRRRVAAPDKKEAVSFAPGAERTFALPENMITPRMRSASVLPSFVLDQPLHRDDVRAKRFRDEVTLWFGADVKAEDVGARDLERWLAWSLYGRELEDIEAGSTARERERSAAKQYLDLSQPPSPLPPTIESFPPSPAPGSQSWAQTRKEELLAEAKGRALDEHERGVAPRDADGGAEFKIEEEDVKNVIAKPGEWDPPNGDRLDFLLYCREIYEARQGFKLKQGEDQKLWSMRLTIDPVKVSGRPLASYLLTNAISMLTLQRAQRDGFKLEKEGRLKYIIRRPAGWTRELAEANSRYRPIIFLHGLGIGLGQYAEFIKLLTKSDLAKTHPILVPLFPHTSQAIFDENFLKPLGHHELTATLRAVIHRESWHRSGVTVLSHSMGTIVGAWLLKSLGTLVRRSCIVDPVCFTLWVPHVIGNFLYNKPDTPVRQLMRFFVGSEIGTSYALSRHFSWASNLLWPQDDIPNLLDNHRTQIYLSEEDAILSASANRRYLRQYGMREAHEGGNLTMAKGAAHGEVLMASGPHMKNILAWLDTPDPEDVEKSS